MNNTTSTFGTITWAIETSKKMQITAQKEIAKRKAGLTYMHLPSRLKFYLAILTGAEYKGLKNWGKISKDRGYIILTENEFLYAIGMLSDKDANEIINGKKRVYTGKKIIVAPYLTIGGKLTLAPLR